MSRKMKRAFIAAWWLIVLTVLKPIAAILRSTGYKGGRYRNLWLVSERGNDARDNGIVFFEYLGREHPEVNACYMIAHDAPAKDRDRVAAAGQIVDRGSMRHLLSLVSAEALVSTHDMGYTPDMVVFHHLERMRLFRGKRVFLQHGIIKDDIAWYHHDCFRADIFTCSAKDEYDFVASTFGQGQSVRLLGLCRYDRLPLCSTGKPEVLIMPTWREPLAALSDEEFLQTDYYRAWQAIISDKVFNGFLRSSGLHAIFYPHAEFQKFLPLFVPGEAVTLASKADFDVQELLISCRMLVTDFSSCFFDVAYQGKPVVFYQFDSEEFFQTHYQKGYLDYNRFGTVCKTPGAVFDAVRAGRMVDSNGFFAFHDQENCRRTFDEIRRSVGLRNDADVSDDASVWRGER